MDRAEVIAVEPRPYGRQPVALRGLAESLAYQLERESWIARAKQSGQVVSFIGPASGVWRSGDWARPLVRLHPTNHVFRPSNKVGLGRRKVPMEEMRLNVDDGNRRAAASRIPHVWRKSCSVQCAPSCSSIRNKTALSAWYPSGRNGWRSVSHKGPLGSSVGRSCAR